ncbi:hypothetical protein KSF78_0009286 [Schistosoma japonicum]|nr:hypothetical protein KSF78_0009286 [Schistosoma japonicum]
MLSSALLYFNVFLMLVNSSPQDINTLLTKLEDGLNIRKRLFNESIRGYNLFDYGVKCLTDRINTILKSHGKSINRYYLTNDKEKWEPRVDIYVIRGTHCLITSDLNKDTDRDVNGGGGGGKGGRWGGEERASVSTHLFKMPTTAEYNINNIVCIRNDSTTCLSYLTIQYRTNDQSVLDYKVKSLPRYLLKSSQPERASKFTPEKCSKLAYGYPDDIKYLTREIDHRQAHYSSVYIYLFDLTAVFDVYLKALALHKNMKNIISENNIQR